MLVPKILSGEKFCPAKSLFAEFFFFESTFDPLLPYKNNFIAHCTFLAGVFTPFPLSTQKRASKDPYNDRVNFHFFSYYHINLGVFENTKTKKGDSFLT